MLNRYRVFFLVIIRFFPGKKFKMHFICFKNLFSLPYNHVHITLCVCVYCEIYYSYCAGWHQLVQVLYIYIYIYIYIYSPGICGVLETSKHKSMHT